MENGAQIFRIEEDHFKTQIFTDLSVLIRVFGSLLGYRFLQKSFRRAMPVWIFSMLVA